jgi:chromosomal replication initiation ATPase DnaA
MLLNHVADATSFADLRTVSGELLLTFHEATERRGLIKADNTLHESLAKATLWMMPYALRRLFATILVFCEPSDVLDLWEKHKEAISEDYRHNNQSSFAVEQMVLIDIRKLLESMQKDIKMYPLPDIDDTYDPSGEIPREIFEEASVEASVEDMALSKTLNEEQQAAYNEIMSTVDSDHRGLFFVDGPGGTGKTYLYRALLATIRSQNKIVMATTTSGVATSIMPGGRTTHSRFKIPLTLDDGAFCTFTKQSGTAKLLWTTSLIIWDEVTMIVTS